MSKTSAVLAGLLMLSAIAPNAAFAAVTGGRAAMTQGQVVDQCRAMEEPSTDNHHAGPAIQACVDRLEHVNQMRSN
ncbi:MAG TPA: hypothetical protein VG271_13375 [Beijerinckiaceae bacterium]|jgi:hypothetical protein|nr:hypothetical protein [Beijerinckiaceae bacterium]